MSLLCLRSDTVIIEAIICSCYLLTLVEVDGTIKNATFAFLLGPNWTAVFCDFES